MPVRNVSTKVQSGREVGSVLSAEQKKQLVKQKAKARKQREKAPRSVQDSIDTYNTWVEDAGGGLQRVYCRVNTLLYDGTA